MFFIVVSVVSDNVCTIYERVLRIGKKRSVERLCNNRVEDSADGLFIDRKCDKHRSLIKVSYEKDFSLLLKSDNHTDLYKEALLYFTSLKGKKNGMTGKTQYTIHSNINKLLDHEIILDLSKDLKSFLRN